MLNGWVCYSAIALAFFASMESMPATAAVPPPTEKAKIERPVESDLAEFGLAYDNDNQTFAGDWPSTESWNSRFCEGHYTTAAKFRGTIDDSTEFEFNPDGTIDVHGRMKDVYVGGTTSYRSSYTLCREVSGWLGAQIDWVSVHAKVEFPGVDSAPLSQARVTVYSSDFGPMHLGRVVPVWLENQIRKVAQRAFLKIWQRNLGQSIDNWLSKKASQRIRH